MGRGSTTAKITRLDQLLGRLKAGDACTAMSLANELGVSSRTLMRDLEALKEKGYPIETERGRGGGVRLYPRWGIGRLTLNYREVIDLLLALSVLEKMHSQLLLKHLKSVRNKLFGSFPDAMRPMIMQLRSRILVGEMASENVLVQYKDNLEQRHSSTLLEGFFEKKCVVISYRSLKGESTKRQIEIHYLFLNWPVWYLIAWDHLRKEPRTFRADRVDSAILKQDIFRLKALSQFSEELANFARPL